MSIMTMNAETLGKAVGQVVPEMYVTMAKNSVAGMDKHGIADILGVEPQEVEEVFEDQLFKDVRLLIAAEYARTQVETDFTWDSIENEALKGLAKRVPHERDTETLLKIAAVANKAQRRQTGKDKGVLDPNQSGTRVAISLSQRFIRNINSGKTQVEETRQISVIDGSAKNPSFEDIDSLLGVSRKPAIPSKMQVTTHDADFDVDDLKYGG